MEIKQWLKNLDLEEYVEAFANNDIDDRVLADLTSDDLKDIGVSSVGHRRLLLGAIAEPGNAAEPSLAVAETISGAYIPTSINGMRNGRKSWKRENG